MAPRFASASVRMQAAEQVDAVRQILELEHALPRRAGVEPAPLQVDHRDEVGGVLGDQAVALLAAAQGVAADRHAAGLLVHHVGDRAHVAERADRAERGDQLAGGRRVVEAAAEHPEQRPGRAAEERPGEARGAAVHDRVQRGGADEAEHHPGREAERRAPGAEQRRVEDQVVELGADRAGGDPGAPVDDVRVGEELQREERPGERPGAALPEHLADHYEAIEKCRGPDVVVGGDQPLRRSMHLCTLSHVPSHYLKDLS